MGKEDMYRSLCYFINSEEELKKVQSELKDGLNKHRSVPIRQSKELIPEKVDLSLIGKPNISVKCKSISIFLHSTCIPILAIIMMNSDNSLGPLPSESKSHITERFGRNWTESLS